MKRKEIKERAETFGAKFEGGKVNGTVTMNRHDFENLIMAVQIYISSKEREECATVCDKEINPNADKHEPVSQYQSGCYITAEFLAATIRARGIGIKYAEED
ncbi:MAG: hypothetical protein RL680_989 [Actinomycetota bacterium]|jgi:hypothetical protein